MRFMPHWYECSTHTRCIRLYLYILYIYQLSATASLHATANMCDETSYEEDDAATADDDEDDEKTATPHHHIKIHNHIHKITWFIRLIWLTLSVVHDFIVSSNNCHHVKWRYAKRAFLVRISFFHRAAKKKKRVREKTRRIYSVSYYFLSER